MTVLRRILAGVLLGAVVCSVASAAVTASVERDQLAAGDTVQLTLNSDGGGSGQPDLAPLAKDFEVLGKSTGSSLQIINGHTTSRRQVVLTLAPRHGGRIEVPPLQWDGAQSAPVVVNIAANAAGKPGGAGAAAAASHVFLTTTLASAQPYVQAGVTLKVRLYSDQALYQANLDLPGSSDVRVKHIGKDTQTQETRDGRAYQVIERSYVLFAQRSGEIKLDGPVLDAQVADDRAGIDPLFGRMFGQLRLPGGLNATRPLRLHGDPITLAVRPRPPGIGGQDWLPAQQLTLEEHWQPVNGALTTGQPVTRHLSLSAAGLSAEQLPDLSTLLRLPPGVKAYPDQARLSNDEQSGHIVGQREQDIALLVDRPGRYELPALSVSWWDTTTNQRREAVLPAHTLDIAPGAASTAPATAAAAPASALAATGTAPAGMATATPARAAAIPAAAGTPATRWAWISLGLGVLWLGTLAAWAWTRHIRKRANTAGPQQHATNPAAVSPVTARKAALRACRDHAPRPARDAVMAWARAAWPDHPPAGLNALARRLDDAAVTPLLQDLDRACIADAPWQGEALAGVLASLNGSDSPRQTAAQLPGLPGLYSDQRA